MDENEAMSEMYLRVTNIGNELASLKLRFGKSVIISKVIEMSPKITAIWERHNSRVKGS